MCQHRDPPACVSGPLCPSPSPRKTYPNRCKTAVLRMLPLVGGASLRCRWEVEPHSQDSRGGGFKSCCSPGAARCWVHLAWVCCRQAGLDLAGWGRSRRGRDPAGPGFSLACASSSAPAGSSLRIQEGSGSRNVTPARTRKSQGDIVGVSFFPFLT